MPTLTRDQRLTAIETLVAPWIRDQIATAPDRKAARKAVQQLLISAQVGSFGPGYRFQAKKAGIECWTGHYPWDGEPPTVIPWGEVIDRLRAESWDQEDQGIRQIIDYLHSDLYRPVASWPEDPPGETLDISSGTGACLWSSVTPRATSTGPRRARMPTTSKRICHD